MKKETENETKEKIVELDKIVDLMRNNPEDDGTFSGSLYDLYLFIGVTKGVDDINNGRGIPMEEYMKECEELDKKALEEAEKRKAMLIGEEIASIGSITRLVRNCPEDDGTFRSCLYDLCLFIGFSHDMYGIDDIDKFDEEVMKEYASNNRRFG